MANNQDRRKIETIANEPLSKHRLFLSRQLREAEYEDAKPFTLAQLKEYYDSIPVAEATFKEEILNALEAVQAGKAPRTPQLDNPEKQLVWGAALAYLKMNPDVMKTWKKPLETGMVDESEIWGQITGTIAARREIASHASHVNETLRDKSITYGWSEPTSGFEFRREKNSINIDLMQTMIAGFEHARADVYREIGHAFLSDHYPDRMQEIFKELRPLAIKVARAKAKKGPELKQDEYKRYMLLNKEFSLRHMMFNAGEENVTSRFVSNVGEKRLQDFSVSLNNTAVTLRGIGLMRLPEEKDASPELRRYMNLCNAVRLSFFANNELFDNTDAGWRQVGIEPNVIRKTATFAARPEGAKGDKDGVNHPDFQYLRELCSGPEGLENLQPKMHERLYGFTAMMGRVKSMNTKRNDIIEQIWALYAEDLIQAILKQENDMVERKLKDKQQQQDQEGEEQEGEEQEGEEQEGEGQGKGKGKGKKSQKKKDPKRGQQQGEEQDEDGEEGEGQEGEEQEGEEQEGQGKGKKGQEKDEDVPVEGAGNMEDADNAAEKPSDEVDPDADPTGEGKDADGEGDDADGQTLEELEEDAQEGEEADGEDADGEDADGEGEGDGEGPGKKKKSNKPGNQPGKGAGKGGEKKTLADLAKQDWTNYSERIAELAEPIALVRRTFKEIQKRQLQRKQTLSRSLDIIPEAGELKERFNLEAHRALTIKKQTGHVEEEDLKRFQKDETTLTPTELDIVLMIDGSGSMNGTPLLSSLQAAAILYEAAAGKDMKMNVYVGMWGPNDPPILIRPGDDPVKIGRAMEAAKKGLNSGTDFAPAVQKIAQTISEQRGKSGTLSGFTHVLIISDGDISDAVKSKEKMNTMFDFSDKVTFDTAIITAQKGTAMEKMAKGLPAKKPFQEVGVVLNNDPNEAPMAIVGLLLDKVRKCGSFTAVPNSQKRRAMKKALNKMENK